MTTLAPDSATQLTSGSTVMVEALLLARAKPSSMATALRQTMIAVMDPKGTRVAVLPALARPSTAAWAYRGGASSARAGMGTMRRASKTSQCTSIHARGAEGMALAISRGRVLVWRKRGSQAGDPAGERRIVDENGVIADGAGGDQRDADPAQLGEPVQVLARLGGQVLVVPQARRRALPSRELLPHRLGLVPDPLLLREVREHLVVVLVADADLDRLAGVQHVELGDGQGVEPIDPRGVAQADGVHPSAASRPARDRAELLAPRAQQIGNVAAQLRGERAAPHPRAIGLGDPDRPVDLGRGYARARAGAARGRARRRDEGVRAVIEIQHGPLGTLEEHGGARLHPAVEEKGGVGDIGRQPSSIAEIRAQDALDGEALRVVDLAEEPVLLRHVVFELLAEQALVEEIGHADAHAGGLVGIGGPHALARGADAVLARLGLAGPVERGVIGHDHVRVLGDVEVAVEGDPALDDRLHLLDQRGRIDDDAAADDVA